MDSEEPLTAEDFAAQARALTNQRDFVSAEVAYRLAIGASEESFGLDHIETAIAVNNLAVFLLRLKRYTEAEPYFLRSRKIFTSQPSGFDALDATCFHNLGLLYQKQERYHEALEHYQLAAERREKVLGANSVVLARSLAGLAETLEELGRYVEAGIAAERALAIREKNPEAALKTEVADSCYRLARIRLTLHMVLQSLALYERAYSIRAEILGDSHADTLSALTEIGWAQMNLDRYADAEKTLMRAASARRGALGALHSDTADSLALLSSLFLRTNRYAEAEQYCTNALNILERLENPSKRAVAEYLAILAAIFEKTKREDQADELYARVYEMRRDVLGLNHVDTANSLNTVALKLARDGNHQEATSLLHSALPVFRASLGPTHVNSIIAQGNLINELRHLKSWEEMLPLEIDRLNLMEQSSELHRERLPQSHYAIADTLIALERPMEAATHLKRAIELAESIGQLNKCTDWSLRLAAIYSGANHHEDACRTLLAAVKFADNAFGAHSIEMANVLFKLAIEFIAHHKLPGTERLLTQAIAIYEASSDDRTASIAISYSHLAELYKRLSRVEDSETARIRSVNAWSRGGAKYRLQLAAALSKLADFYMSHGKPKEAEPMFRRASEIYDNEPGATVADRLVSRFNLAALCVPLKSLQEAANLLESVRSELESGVDCPQINEARVLAELCFVYDSMERLDEAEAVGKRAVALLEQAGGRHNPALARPLNNLAMVKFKRKELEDAEGLLSRALLINHMATGPENDLSKLIHTNLKAVRAQIAMGKRFRF